MINFPEDARGRELILMIERAKYERWLSAEVEQLLKREFDRVVDTIVSPSFRFLTASEQAQKLQLFRELERQFKTLYGSVTDLHVRELAKYADVESEIARSHVEMMLATPSGAIPVSLGSFLPPTSLRSIAALPIQGLRISEWFDAQANTMSLATRRVIQQALIEGKGPADIIRRIVPARGSVDPSVYRRARAEATAITRTTVTAVQSNAAQRTYEALPDTVSDSYIYQAIRDSRTTPICRAADGNIYRYKDPKKKVPPQHVGCRSGTRALVKGADVTLSAQRAPHTFASYNDWLRAQSTGQQNEILGPGRADLWRSGKMTLADAIDADNRILTLAQLRNRFGAGVGAGR